MPFDDTGFDVEHLFLFAFCLQSYSAFRQAGDYRGVVFEYFEQSASSGQLQQRCRTVIECRVGFYYLNVHILLFVWPYGGRCGSNRRSLSLVAINGLLGFGKDFFAFLDGLFDGSHQKESLFGQIVHVAIQNHIEALDGVVDIDEFALQAGEGFGHEEGL